MSRCYKSVVVVFLLLFGLQRLGAAEIRSCEALTSRSGGLARRRDLGHGHKSPQRFGDSRRKQHRLGANHQAIEFLTKFNGQPHYNGFYAYNAATKTIGFYYTSSEGDLTIGTAVPDPDGKTLRQDFDLTDADGKVTHIRSTIVRDGDNAYWFTVFLQKNGEWSPEFKIHYERK